MNTILRAPVARRDLDLKRDVLAEVERQRDRVLDCVGVSVRRGLVTLRGRISSHAALQALEKAVRRVPGVWFVSSELTVTGRVAGAGDDESCLVGAVHRALRSNRLLVGSAITPNVEDGWVELQGMAPLPYQPAVAVAAVRRLPGIRGVTNQIRTCDAPRSGLDTTGLKLRSPANEDVGPAASRAPDGPFAAGCAGSRRALAPARAFYRETAGCCC